MLRMLRAKMTRTVKDAARDAENDAKDAARK